MLSYKAIIPIGFRCYTEIFLKQLGYKNFSCPFDSILSKSIDNIIYLFENKIEYDKLIYTENEKNDIIDELNKKHGLRTIHTQFDCYDVNDYDKTYHLATFAHHNLNDNNTKEHFERCFKRLDIIKHHKMKTLFCLFIHVNDKDISFEEINKLKYFLIEHFNCDLLICNFKFTFDKYTWNIRHNENNLTYIHINNSSVIFEENEKVLNEIFQYLKIDKSQLLTYNEIKNLINEIIN
jgi:hypothetical protein